MMRAVARLLAVTGVLLVPGVAQARESPCGPSGARTLAANRVARVYVQGVGVYGCSRANSRTYTLGSSTVGPGQTRVVAVALAGPVAAYGLSTFGVDTVSATVVVRRLTDGKQLVQRPAFVGVLPPEFTVLVESVVVKRDGAVAWIVEGGSIISAEKTTEVVALSHGHERLLDSTAAGVIDPKSLRLRASKLTWTRGGAQRSATLS
jgi:hypothetical protein